MIPVKWGFRFTLHSDKWHPARPGWFDFEALIQQCSNPEAVLRGGRPLSMLPKDGKTGWRVLPQDVLQFTKPATISGLGLAASKAEADALVRCGFAIDHELERAG